MHHLWLLMLFIKPTAMNTIYKDPVLMEGYFATYADCSAKGREIVTTDGTIEEYACTARPAGTLVAEK